MPKTRFAVQPDPGGGIVPGSKWGGVEKDVLMAAGRMAAGFEKSHLDAVGFMGSVPGSLDFGVGVASGRDSQMSAQAFKGRWAAVSPEAMFRVSRRVALENGSIRGFLKLRRAQGSSGFSLAGTDGRAWLTRLRGTGFPVDRLVADVWREWLVTQNVLCWWEKRKGVYGELPHVWVHPAEDIVEYRDGPKPMVKIRMNRTLLAETTPGKFAPKTDTGEVELTEDRFGWAILTASRTGEGLAVPDLYSIFFDLAIGDLLQTGDWNAAWMMRTIVEHVTKGHEIGSGPMAGQNRYHLRRKDRDAIEDTLKQVRGIMRWITNFDVKRDFSHLDPKYMGAEKWEALRERIDEWGGPLLMLLRNGGRVLPAHMYDLARDLGEEERGLVGGLLGEVLGKVTAEGGAETVSVGGGGSLGPLPGLRVTWNPLTYLIGRERPKMLSFLSDRALLSPQSLREYLCLDDSLENARMAEAHAAPMNFTPVHVPNAGASPEAGRPAEDGADADDMMGE